MHTFYSVFDFEDTIYFMSDNKIVSGTVRAINVRSKRIVDAVDGEPRNSYLSEFEYYVDEFAEPIPETRAFESEASLIGSISE